MNLLEIEHLSVGYGNRSALQAVSFSVVEGGSLVILGANGAGKSTVLRSIAGLTTPATGSIRYNGHELVGVHAERIHALGVALVPEGRRLFPDHTLLENLELGAYGCGWRRGTAEFQSLLEYVLRLFPWMESRLGELAGALSGGEQQMVAISRALMSRPRLLLLDEPSLGLSPVTSARVFAMLRKLNDQGLTVLMAEQKTRAGLRTCKHALLLRRGEAIKICPSEELGRSQHLVDAYMDAGEEDSSSTAARFSWSNCR